MKHRKLLIVILLLQFTIVAVSQEKENPLNSIKFEFHGFIKTDFWYDTRQVANAREDLFALYPLPPLEDPDGIDIFAKSSFNFSAITTRANVRISGPDAFGAKTVGFIEADFSGVTNGDINGFRLRHAFLKFSWENADLLLGQYWHPMFVTDVFPSVISLNTGAPFQPFIRSPQVRFTYRAGKLKIMAALLAQRDYANDGPTGRNHKYLSNSSIPNAHLQLKYIAGDIIAGVAGDFKVLRPRLFTDSSYNATAQVSSVAVMAYFRFKRNNFSLMAKTILGQNMTEHLLLGGYAVSSKDLETGRETYTPTSTSASWINLMYGKKIKAGLFAGYTKNLGTADKNIGIYYSRGSNIDYVYRIAPSISFISNKAQISTEFEYTVAAYGIPDAMGRVQDVSAVSNFRVLLTVFYFF